MKFKVREGFVVNVSEKIEVGENKFEVQTQTFYAGKIVDLSPEQADDHAHKLEPLDKGATEYLAAKPLPAPAATAQADISALVAAEVARVLLAAQATAKA